jgi:hypothetical protein
LLWSCVAAALPAFFFPAIQTSLKVTSLGLLLWVLRLGGEGRLWDGVGDVSTACILQERIEVVELVGVLLSPSR